MIGADKIVRTIEEGGADVCFTNPGTSEMHFVAALGRTSRTRCVLGLFEGVVTGAADGFYRMARRPATTLLHLGPGLANGIANLHNAKKAHSGILNVVGEHATHHLQHDPPLMSDIEGIARPVAHWVKRAGSVDDLAGDAAEALSVAGADPGRIAVLIVPADLSWSEANGRESSVGPLEQRRKVRHEAILESAKILREGASSLLLIGDVGLLERGVELAGRIAAKTGCQIRAPIFNARTRRGAGLPEVPRVPHAGAAALEALAGVRNIVLCGAAPPVSSFAFPDVPNVLSQPSCAFHTLAAIEQDICGALEGVADELGATTTAPTNVSERARYDAPAGPPTSSGIARAIVAALPENPIIIDEAVSSGRSFAPITAEAGPHDWLQNMGGAIGFGMPTGIGAAIACPDRKVLCMIGDGSAMYTEQALWTMARENLDITVLIFSNGGYTSLKAHLPRVGIPEPDMSTTSMLSLDAPRLKWSALAEGHGVENGRAENLEQLSTQLRRGFSSDGPYLVELVV